MSIENRSAGAFDIDNNDEIVRRNIFSYVACMKTARDLKFSYYTVDFHRQSACETEYVGSFTNAIIFISVFCQFSSR